MWSAVAAAAAAAVVFDSDSSGGGGYMEKEGPLSLPNQVLKVKCYFFKCFLRLKRMTGVPQLVAKLLMANSYVFRAWEKTYQNL